MANEPRQISKFVDRASRNIKSAESVSSKHMRHFLVRRWDYLRSSRRWVAVWLALVGLLIVASAIQYLWFQKGYQTVSATEGGTYVEATYGKIDNLNPLFASSRSEKAVQKLAFSSLYQYDSRGSLQPDLATTFTPSKDAKKFTVKLRKGITWQDSEPLTAKDVVYTVNLMKDEQVGSPLLSTFSAVSARAIDSQTVEFTLATPYSMFQHALTFSILPEHILQKVEPSLIRESDFSHRPIGSGPFEVKLLQTINASNNEKIVHLVSNPSYYAGEPKLSRYEIHNYTSRDDIVEALRSAEVNATTDVIDTDKVDTRRYVVDNVPVSSGAFALFNTSDGLLKDSAVRKAIQTGTNTNQLRDEVDQAVRPMYLPFLKGNIGDVSSIKLPAFDTEKAKNILDKAGWKIPKNGSMRTKKGQQLDIRIVLQSGNRHSASAENLKKQWTTLGINADITVVDPRDKTVNFSQDYLRPRQYDVLIYDLLIGSDLDSYPYWHSSQASGDGLNFSNYSSVGSDEAIISARIATDPALRRAKAQSFAKRWVNDAPAIALYQDTIPYIHSRSIKSYGTTSELISANDQYSDVHNWYIEQRSVYKTP